MSTADDPSHRGGGDPVAGRRFPRFVAPPNVRKLALPRVVLALLAGAGALVLVVALGSATVRSLSAYLHRQSEYQFEFRRIELRPSPPLWFRGGAAAFLERVRAESSQPERQSLLEADLGALARAFRLDCWVRKVERVERSHPNRVVVRLAYREPVAEFEVPGRARLVVVDREGVILPDADLDHEALGPLVRLYGMKPPHQPHVGETWKRPEASSGGGVPDESVAAAARLAEFLRRVQDQLKLIPQTSGRRIVVHAGRKDALWVQYGNLLFRWNEPPGAEEPGELSAQAKWELLRDWLDQHDPSFDKQAGYHFYEIAKSGIVAIDPPHPGSRQNPK
jgi:hypothetical protein